LSANQKVDHSTICNFILQYQQEIKGIFSKLLYVMTELGYVSMDFVAVDGTKIRANAGKKFTGDVADFARRRKRLERKMEEIIHHTTDEKMSEKYRNRKLNKLDALRRERDRIDAFLGEVEEKGKRKEVAQRKVSLTDPDAGMVKDKDTQYMGYNCQIGVDEKSHVIVGAEVFSEARIEGFYNLWWLKRGIEMKMVCPNGSILDKKQRWVLMPVISVRIHPEGESSILR
jgi:hypothetical protein